MSSLTIVSDATPLIALAKLDGISWLHQLLGEIIIPEAVYDEVVVAGANKIGSDVIDTAHWIHVHQVKDKTHVLLLLNQLDRGESEAIALAYELKADWLLMDEIRGRSVAKTLGLQVIGTVGLLVNAKEVGIVSEVRPLLDSLLVQDFRLSKRVITETLRRAGEL